MQPPLLLGPLNARLSWKTVAKTVCGLLFVFACGYIYHSTLLDSRRELMLLTRLQQKLGGRVQVLRITGLSLNPQVNYIRLPRRRFSDRQLRAIAETCNELRHLDTLEVDPEVVVQDNREFLRDLLRDDIFIGTIDGGFSSSPRQWELVTEEGFKAVDRAQGVKKQA